MIKKQSHKKNGYSSVILVIFFLFLILTFRSFTSKPFKVPKEVQAITGTLNFNAGIGTQTFGSPNMANLYVTGNVGIGTAQPGAKLTIINSAADTVALSITQTGNYFGGAIDVSGSTTGSGLSVKGNAAGSDQRLFTVSTDGTTNGNLFKVQNDGKVGIGTTAPTSKLHVVTGVAGNLVNFSDGVAQSFSINTTAGGYSIDNANGGYIAFSNTAEHLRILANGNVGIGTTPEYKLDVNGRTNSTSSSGAGGYISTGNYGGTGTAAYFPSGLWSNGSNAWIYGTVYFNGALSGATTGSFSGAVTASSFTGNVYADTINSSVNTDPLELNYYNTGDIRFYGGDLTMNLNRIIYPGSISGLSAFQKSYYLASHATWGLYTNTSLNAQGLYDVGNRVCSASAYGGCATHRGEGTNYVDYARYMYDNGAYSGGAAWREPSSFYVYYAYLGRLVYNNGAYSGSGWVEPSDLGVRYAASAGNANTVGGLGTGSFRQFNVWQNSHYSGTNGTEYASYGFYSGGSYPTYINYGNIDDGWLRFTTNSAGTFHAIAVGSLFAGGAQRYDLAEITPVDPNENLQIGELVSTDPTYNNGLQLHRTSSEYQTDMVGIVSNVHTASFVIGGDVAPEHMDKVLDKKPIALTGRVTTLVNLESGPIHVGDPITSSHQAGVGMKANKVGSIISKAMESYDGKRVNSIEVEKIIQQLKKEIEDAKKADKNNIVVPNIQKAIDQLTAPLPPKTGRIITFVSIGYHDPDTALISTNGLNIENNNNDYSLKDKNHSIVSRIGAFAELIVAKIQAGLIETKKLIVDGVDILKKLNELSVKVESQQKQIDELKKTIDNRR